MTHILIMTAAETRTAKIAAFWTRYVAMRTASNATRESLAAVRDEIARGFENESEAAEYDESERFLIASYNEGLDQIRALFAEMNKAGSDIREGFNRLQFEDGQRRLDWATGTLRP